MKTSLFSIITICYNSAKTIERTIKSVQAQTFTGYEYIIVDGASKDNTLEIVSQYKGAFGDKLRVISEPDSGIYDAMNKGIRAAQGKIIGIVNSDDWLEPDALETVNTAFKENDNREDCLYCGGIKFVTEQNEIVEKPVNLNAFYKNTKYHLMVGIRHPATFVPKQVYDKLGSFDSRMKISADRDFILRCHFNGVKFVAIDKFLSNMSEGGVSTNITKRMLKNAINDRKMSLKNFGKKGLEFYYLYYYWRIRFFIANIIKKIGLSKDH